MILFIAFIVAGNLAAWALVRHNDTRAQDYDRLTGRVFEA